MRSPTFEPLNATDYTVRFRVRNKLVTLCITRTMGQAGRKPLWVVHRAGWHESLGITFSSVDEAKSHVQALFERMTGISPPY